MPRQPILPSSGRPSSSSSSSSPSSSSPSPPPFPSSPVVGSHSAVISSRFSEFVVHAVTCSRFSEFVMYHPVVGSQNL